MKTTIILPRKPVSKPKPTTFPAIYKDLNTDNLVIATTATNGVVIYSSGLPGSSEVGYQYVRDKPWEVAYNWVRLTDPVTIKFQP